MLHTKRQSMQLKRCSMCMFTSVYINVCLWCGLKNAMKRIRPTKNKEKKHWMPKIHSTEKNIPKSIWSIHRLRLALKPINTRKHQNEPVVVEDRISLCTNIVTETNKPMARTNGKTSNNELVLLISTIFELIISLDVRSCRLSGLVLLILALVLLRL